MGTLDPEPQLIIRVEGNVVAIHALPYGAHVLGRDPSASVRIDHPDVSRHHVQLEVDVDGVMLFDSDSKNGVFVRGQRLTDPVRLVHGDSFVVGHVTFELIHPPSHIDQALAAAGETTITRRRVPESGTRVSMNLSWPLLAVAVFALLLAATLLL